MNYLKQVLIGLIMFFSITCVSQYAHAGIPNAQESSYASLSFNEKVMLDEILKNAALIKQLNDNATSYTNEDFHYLSKRILANHEYIKLRLGKDAANKLLKEAIVMVNHEV